MMWLRKSFVHLLASLLLLSLLVLGVSTAVVQNFSQPAKVEGWLGNSNIYGHFVKDVILQSDQSIGSTSQLSSISLSDTAVQQAAQSAFSQQLIQHSINTVIDSNYAWLQGKTAVPEFKVDLTAAKQSFAKQVGTYVTNYFSTLPVCSSAQLAALKTVDPLSAPCRPSNVSAQEEGQTVRQQLAQSGDFLGNTVLTPTTINAVQGKKNLQPYYSHLAGLPKVYRATVALPWVALGVAVLTGLGVVFIYPSRRRGLRKVGYALFLAGVILLAGKIAVDILFKHVKKNAFNGSSVGQLQQSLTNFLNQVEHSVTQTELYFAVGFIVLALVIFVSLFMTRNRIAKSKPVTDEELSSVSEAAPAVAEEAPANKPAIAPATKPTAPVVKKSAAPIGGKPRPGSGKRPRLIQ